MEEILIFIACRLDKELLNTINDAIIKASEPNNLDFVVYNQDFQEDAWIQSQFPERVTLINVDQDKTRELAQIRQHALLYIKPSHKYYLCIDAHTRFDEEWDTILKQNLNGYGKKCVISAYPKTYKIADGNETLNKHETHIVNKIVSDAHCNYTFRFEAVSSGLNQPYDKSNIAGGFHFTFIDWLINVGYDPYVGWDYHELDTSLMSYTFGYDIVNAKNTPVYHLYDHSQRKSLKAPSFSYSINRKQRMINKLNNIYLTELDLKYAFGKQRTVQQWMKDYDFDLLSRINIHT